MVPWAPALRALAQGHPWVTVDIKIGRTYGEHAEDFMDYIAL